MADLLDRSSEGGMTMHDSFSNGHVYYGRTLLALGGSIVLAALLQVL
jgi:hypothetical protein